MSATLSPELQNLFRRFGKAFNACDIDGILACVTPDFRWIMARGPEAPHGRIVTGRDALRATIMEREQELTGIRFSEAQVFAAGDSVIGTFRMKATRRSDNSGIDLRGCDIYTVRDGLIASKDSSWTQLTPGV